MYILRALLALTDFTLLLSRWDISEKKFYAFYLKKLSVYYIEAKGETSVIFSVLQHIFIKGFAIESFLRNFQKLSQVWVILSPSLSPFIFDVFTTFL